MTNVTPSQNNADEPRRQTSEGLPPPAGRKAERSVSPWSSSVPAATVQLLPSRCIAPASPNRRIGSTPSAARIVSRLPSIVNGPSSLGSAQAISITSPSDACRTASPTVPQSSSTAGASTTRQIRGDAAAVVPASCLIDSVSSIPGSTAGPRAVTGAAAPSRCVAMLADRSHSPPTTAASPRSGISQGRCTGDGRATGSTTATVAGRGDDSSMPRSSAMVVRSATRSAGRW